MVPPPPGRSAADVLATERQQVQHGEVDRLLVAIAATHPGIVAKLRMLWGDLEAEVPSRRTAIGLARLLRAMADTLDAHADSPLADR